MKIIETINNALDTVQSIEGILREARAYAAEARQGNGMLALALETECAQAKRIIDARDKRISELEALNSKGNAGFSELMNANSVLQFQVSSGQKRVKELEMELSEEEKTNQLAANEITKLCRKITSLESDVAEMRAKSEPVFDPGEDYVLCSRDDASEWCAEPGSRWNPMHEFGDWKTIKYAFRRPITKSEPVVSGIGEPDYGIGFEKCERVDATDAAHYDNHLLWSEWEPVTEWAFDDPSGISVYAFRRPIAKPAVEAESQWVACTAEEAAKSKNDSEWNQGDNWFSCNGLTYCSTVYAFRTKAQLSEWVTVSPIVYNNLVSAGCTFLASIPVSYKILRSTVDVGTVLG